MKETTKEVAENVVRGWVNGASPPFHLPVTIKYILKHIDMLERKIEEMEK